MDIEGAAARVTAGDSAVPDLRGELDAWLARARRGEALTRHWPQASPLALDVAAEALDACLRNKVVFASDQGTLEMPFGVVPAQYRSTSTVVTGSLERDVVRAALQETDFGRWLLEVARVNCYRSPAGIGTPIHFDAMPSMVVQTVGRKRWWVGDAPADPFTRHNCAPPAGAVRLLHEGRPLPVPDPAALPSLLMTPGDVLFLPAGTWHCTQAESASTSFTLAFPGFRPA